MTTSAPDAPSASAAAPARPTRRRLGEVLVEQGVLTDEQLGDALTTQKQRNGRLGEVLLDLGVVRPDQLLRALATQYGIEYLDLEQTDIDRTLAQKMPEPLARRHRALPVLRDGDVVVVAMANPNDVIALDDVRSVIREPVRPVLADPSQLLGAIARTGHSDEQVQTAIRLAMADAGDTEVEADQRVVSAGADDAPVVRFVDLIIAKALQERASDIHIDPTASAVRVRYRIDGVLHEVMDIPRVLHAGIISRIKVMANVDIAEKRVPQDGRISMVITGKSIDLRVATVPTVYGEASVLRILRRDDGLAPISDLGMDPSQFSRFQSAFRRTWGIVLVTGPTGSGKTTTLYSALRELNHPSRNIMTIEDPVEYRLEGIKQVQVNNRAGLTFARALRSMLRADPDVVLVGEIRDKETATIAVEASLTGHLVLASVHTNDASSTPIRLIEMGVEPYLVTAGLRGVLAQRLARRLCDTCKTPRTLDAAEAAGAEIPRELCNPDGSFDVFEAVGCDKCASTGYRGRFAVNEYLDVDETIGHMILERSSSAAIEARAVGNGMLTLRTAGLLKVRAGVTTLEELLRCIG